MVSKISIILAFCVIVSVSTQVRGNQYGPSDSIPTTAATTFAAATEHQVRLSNGTQKWNSVITTTANQDSISLYIRDSAMTADTDAQYSVTSGNALYILSAQETKADTDYFIRLVSRSGSAQSATISIQREQAILADGTAVDFKSDVTYASVSIPATQKRSYYVKTPTKDKANFFWQVRMEMGGSGGTERVKGVYVKNGSWVTDYTCPAATVYNHVGECGYLGVDEKGIQGNVNQLVVTAPYTYGLTSFRSPQNTEYFITVQAEDSAAASYVLTFGSPASRIAPSFVALFVCLGALLAIMF